MHVDGEIYAAIGWRLLRELPGGGLTTDTLLTYLVDGMNFTPATPYFEDMRDGILAAAPTEHDCLVWDAFADFGVGVGASATISKKSVVTVTESFARPAECSALRSTANAN